MDVSRLPHAQNQRVQVRPDRECDDGDEQRGDDAATTSSSLAGRFGSRRSLVQIQSPRLLIAHRPTCSSRVGRLSIQETHYPFSEVGSAFLLSSGGVRLVKMNRLDRFAHDPRCHGLRAYAVTRIRRDILPTREARLEDRERVDRQSRRLLVAKHG
jgi:hypothetical protein